MAESYGQESSFQEEDGGKGLGATNAASCVPGPTRFFLLHIKRARNLPDVDRWNACDAFVDVCYGGESVVRTDPVHRCSCPVWNFLRTFEYRPGALLELHVYAKGGGLLGDEYIGSVPLDVGKLASAAPLTPEASLLHGWHAIGQGDPERRKGPGTTSPLMGFIWRRWTGATLPRSGIPLGEVLISVRYVDIEKYADLSLKQLEAEKKLGEERALAEEKLALEEREREISMLHTRAAVKLVVAIERCFSRRQVSQVVHAISMWRQNAARPDTPANQEGVHTPRAIPDDAKEKIFNSPSRIPGAGRLSVGGGGTAGTPPHHGLSNRQSVGEVGGGRSPNRGRKASRASLGTPPKSHGRRSVSSTSPNQLPISSESPKGRQKFGNSAPHSPLPYSAQNFQDLEQELEASRATCWDELMGMEEGGNGGGAGGEADDESIASMSILVSVRVRPTSQSGGSGGGGGGGGEQQSSILSTEDGNQIFIASPEWHGGSMGEKHQFAFDRVFPQEATQQDVFNGLGTHIIRSTWRGYNTCLFAYGQTASGKSHSMMGSEEGPGLIPRFCDHLFYMAAKTMEADPEYRYNVDVSCLQIYNERIFDLLGSSSRERERGLRMRESPTSGVFIEGLSHVTVGSMQEMDGVIAAAIESRAVGSTSLNQSSSRSHCIFTITFTQKLPKLGGEALEKQSRVNLIDLAGSERSKLARTSGESLAEGSKINQSLSTLGRVIAALAKGGRDHVPYRDSVLTTFLRESLGGNSFTLMLATVSPSAANYEETLSTLRYANSAKRIKTRPVVNEDPTARVIADLQQEVERLRSALKTASSAAATGESSDLAAIEAHIKEVSASSWGNTGELPPRLRRRSSVNEAILKMEHKYAPFLLLSHQDEMISGRLRYPIGYGKTLLGRRSTRYFVDGGEGGELAPDPLAASIPDEDMDGMSFLERELHDGVAKLDFEGVGIRLRHCMVERSPVSSGGKDILTLQPLQSRAFVAVNGNAISEITALKHGDRIVLGCCAISFVLIYMDEMGGWRNHQDKGGLARYKEARIFSHEQIIREVGVGGSSAAKSSKEGSSAQTSQLGGTVMRRMQLLKNIRLLEDQSVKARILASEANTIASDLEQSVSFRVFISIPVRPTGDCSLQSLIETQQNSIRVSIVGFTGEEEGKANSNNSSTISGNSKRNRARWSFEEFSRVVDRLTDAYANLSALLTEKEVRGRGTLLRDIFSSIAAGSKLDAVGPLELREMLVTCGMPEPTDGELQKIMDKYDEDNNGTLEVAEFGRFAQERMTVVFEECLFNEDLSLSIDALDLGGGEYTDIDATEMITTTMATKLQGRKSILGAAWASGEDRKGNK